MDGRLAAATSALRQRWSRRRTRKGRVKKVEGPRQGGRNARLVLRAPQLAHQALCFERKGLQCDRRLAPGYRGAHTRAANERVQRVRARARSAPVKGGAGLRRRRAQLAAAIALRSYHVRCPIAAAAVTGLATG